MVAKVTFPVSPPTPFIPGGGPEDLFAVGGITVDDEGVRGGMTTGPWMAGPGGLAAAGCLGVLVDDVLGYALVARRAGERWSVSTEISIDVLRPLPGDGTRVQALTDQVHTSAQGGLALGRVLDAGGRVIAVCRQRGRYVTQLPPGPATPTGGVQPLVDPVTDGVTLPATDALIDAASLLGVRWPGSGTAEPLLEVTDRLTNPLGNLHGGISLCASELVAMAALLPSGLVTASVQVAYLRPAPVGAVVRFAVTVQHRGRTLAVVQVMGTNDAGKICTIATITAHQASE
jgi:uncharacterized protein (TIGR00369 family)